MLTSDSHTVKSDTGTDTGTDTDTDTDHGVGDTRYHTVVQAFEALAMPLPTSALLAVTKAHSHLAALVAMTTATKPMFDHTYRHNRYHHRKRRHHRRRLSVGYVSSDFKRHPVMSVVGDIFDQHDRRKVLVGRCVWLLYYCKRDGCAYE